MKNDVSVVETVTGITKQASSLAPNDLLREVNWDQLTKRSSS